MWAAACRDLGAEPNSDQAFASEQMGIIKRLHVKKGYDYADIYACWRYHAGQERLLDPENGWRDTGVDFKDVWNKIGAWRLRNKPATPPPRANGKFRGVTADSLALAAERAYHAGVAKDD